MTQSANSAAIQQLSALLGSRLSASAAQLQSHAENESHFPIMPPEAVAQPKNTDEIAQILAICNAHGCPVTAQGARTSLEGHHLAVQGGVALDLSRMDKVLEILPEDMLAIVQPGVTREALNAELRATGLFFPVDPGANATLGGMAATRASGTTAVRYGTMRDAVLAMEVALADGRVIRTGTRARKSSAGYDLTRLMVGSEGTLGVASELTVRLHPLPETIQAATCRFASVEQAIDAVILTIQSGIPMARIELVDAMMVRGFNLYGGTALPELPHLFLEFHGSESTVAEQVESFNGIAEEFGATDFAWASTTEDRNALWKMRHNAHFAVRSLRSGSRTISTDVCVPISKLAEAISRARQHADQLNLTCAMLGHVGDGNFHCGVLMDPDDAAEVANIDVFTNALAATALELGGTVTGEHGVGLGKRKYMRAEHGDAIDVMQTLKDALDPKGILNPGKMFSDRPTPAE